MDYIYQNNILVKIENYNNEKTIVIPDGITAIGDSVFKGMRTIEEVTLPESVVSIKANAFKGCRNLKGINFPQNLCEVGDFAFHRCHSLESVILPDSVNHVGKGAFLCCDSLKKIALKGVQRIEMQTFTNCTAIEELSLNIGLDTSNLGDDIFTGCTKINKINFSDGSEYSIPNLIEAIDHSNNIISTIAKSVYKSMKLENGRLYKFSVNLKDVTIPEGITSIERGCFSDKKGIVSIVFPMSLKKICANAFVNCISLKKIVISNPNIKKEDIEDDAFRGCSNLTDIIFDGVTDVVKKIHEQVYSDFYISGCILMRYSGHEERISVPNGIRIISEKCFMGNDRIDRIILPDSVEEIRDSAFRNCTSLQSIELSADLRKIGTSAFENCRQLLKITLPDNVRTIEKSAFKRCRKLNFFDVNKKLEYIGDMAFYGCSELKNIDIPFDTVLDGDMIFFNSGYTRTYIQPYQFCGDDTITELEISTPHTIGRYAFSGCKNLESVKIINSDCIIDEYAFEKCPKLKSISVNAKHISKGAFSFCQNLESVYINTPEINDYTFFECVKLKDVSLLGNVKTIGRNAFEECTSLEHFPFEAVESVGESAFARCEGFSKISLHGKKSIGRHAFEDCCNIKRLDIDSCVATDSGAFFSCTYIDEIVLDGLAYSFSRFSDSINSVDNKIPERIQEIIGDIYSCFHINRKNELLKYYGNSTSVKIPDDVVSVGDESFRNCLRCKYIAFPEALEYIGKLAFDGTGWLNRIRQYNKINIINNMIADGANCGEYAEIPSEIKRVISWAFAGNTNLKELKFLGERTIVDEFSFRNCINLHKIILADGTCYNVNEREKSPDFVQKIFAECLNCFKTDEAGNLVESTGNIKNLVFPQGIKSIADEVYKDCNLLESIVLSDDTAEIGKSAFENSKWLRCVENAVGVVKIGDFAFNGCQSLETVEFSDNLREIGKRAFEHCCRLKEIVIPEGVKVIRERTFFRCKSLKKVILSSTLESIEKEAFAFCDNLETVVISKNTRVNEKAFVWTNAETEYI